MIQKQEVTIVHFTADQLSDLIMADAGIRSEIDLRVVGNTAELSWGLGMDGRYTARVTIVQDLGEVR